jgi:microcystin degradation protein MlrC
MDMALRIALAGIGQEQDTFNPAETQLDAFRAQGLWTGEDILRHEGGAGMVGGMLASLAGRIAAGEVQPVPLVKATAVPGGRVAAPVLAELTDMLTTALRDALRDGPVDGVALLMHGACAATGVDDVEGHLLAATRAVIGDAVPIAVGLDHHANITAAMVRLSDAIVGHRTQPHDPFDTGRLTGEILLRILHGARPAMASRTLRLLSHQEQYLTAGGPMKTWFDRAREWESRPGVLSVSPFPMQPWLDVTEGGWSVVAVTDGRADLAEEIVDEMADLAWSMRAEYQVATAIPVADAVARAHATPGLVILSDTGDSVFGGAAGDSTVVLAELLATDGIRALVPMVDPGATAHLVAAGVGAEVDVELGGAITGFFSPVRVSGTVLAVDQPVLRLSGYPEPQVQWGPVALLRAGGVVIAVSERPGVAGNHPGAYQHFGLDPADFDAVVLKTASNFQYFGSFTDTVIRVATPGPTQSDIAGLPWQRIPRPIYPLDDIDSWRG